MSGFWQSLSPAWQACLEEAWAAYCAGSVPIGAIVTAPDGSILARGRNRIHEPVGEPGLLYGHTLAHAEINALAAIPSDDGIDRNACALYTTTEPCPLCLGALYMSGVRRFSYASRDPYAGSANLLGTTPYLSRKPVTACGPERDDLEVLIMAMYVVFVFEKHLARGHHPVFWFLLDEWKAVVSEGVAFGQALAQAGQMARLRASGLPPAQVFERLSELQKDETDG